MAAITRRHFETGTITGNDGFNSISGSPTIDSSSKIKGINSARTNWTGSANVNGTISGLSASEFWVQYYFNVAAYPSATSRITTASNGSTQWNITMGTAGSMNLRNNSTGISTNFLTASLNTTYRIGIHFKKETTLGAGDGILELYTATGDNAFGSAVYSSAAYSMNSSANAITSIVFGQNNGAAATGDIYWDAICLDDAAMPATGDATLLDDLVAYWKLDETSGSRADSAGSNTLTDNNTVTSTTGKQSNAATFTRANTEALSITDNTALSMGDIFVTIAFWARLTSKPVDGDGNMAAVSKWNYNNSNREYSVGYNNTNDAFNFSVTGDGSTQTHLYATTFGSPSTGTWYFIVAQHDPSTNTISISVNNGTADSTSYSSGIFNGTASFGLGAMFASSDLYWDGDIDEVGIWKRKLSSTEITSLYNSGSGKTYPFTSNTDTPMTVSFTATGSFTMVRSVGKRTSITSSITFSVSRGISLFKSLNVTAAVTAPKNIPKLFSVISTTVVNKASDVGKPVEIVSNVSSVIVKDILKPVVITELIVVTPIKNISKLIEMVSNVLINSSLGRGYYATIEVTSSAIASVQNTIGKLVEINEGVSISVQKLFSLSIPVHIVAPIVTSVQRDIQKTQMFLVNAFTIFSKNAITEAMNVYLVRNVGSLTLGFKNSIVRLLDKNARTITIEGTDNDNN